MASKIGWTKPTEAKILRAVCGVYPDTIEWNMLAERTNYSPSTGHFRNQVYKLSGLGLIEKKGSEIVASSELFPEE